MRQVSKEGRRENASRQLIEALLYAVYVRKCAGPNQGGRRLRLRRRLLRLPVIALGRLTLFGAITVTRTELTDGRTDGRTSRPSAC